MSVRIIQNICIAFIVGFTTIAGFAQKHPTDLTSIPWLPDPMMLRNEVPIESEAQWEEQKEWIKEQLQKYYLGYMPPIPLEVKDSLIEIRYDGDVRIEHIELFFGVDFQAKMTIELYFPGEADDRLPVFMTQWNHDGWIGTGLRRGYMGCLYAGADAKDDTRNYGDLYPDHSFARLMQRAWGATAVVTYLYSRPEVDTDRIAISGHSRNGKQSLYVAAFDDRIDAVIPSSSGFVGIRTARHSDRRFAPHTMHRTMVDFPDWWIPGLRDFVGHEDRLPVDMNSLMAIVAPRPSLLSAGVFDLYGDTYGLEASYVSARKAYSFLGQPDALQIRQRPVRHNTHARDIEDFFDFLDTQFGIREFPVFDDRYHLYTFDNWLENNRHVGTDDVSAIDLASYEHIGTAEKGHIRENLNWLLGDVLPGLSYQRERDLVPGTKEDNLATIFRTRETIGGANRIRVSPYTGMGDQLYADFYYPNTGEPHYPVVIFLHEYTYAEGYGKTSWPGFEMNDYISDLIDAGYAVLAFDMIGFATRQKEAVRFYERYPHWSLMGKMVEDVKAAIDVAAGFPVADTSQVILSGYALGATVAVMASVFDDRVTDLVVLDPFSPFRSQDPTIEGIAHFFAYTGLIPRLGLFHDREMDVPVDMQEILAASQARKTIVINERSRHIDAGAMKAQLNRAAEHDAALNVLYVPEISDFRRMHRELLIEQMRSYHDLK